jgi:pimeloyl-ACP methyl ester carboxylesterase
MVIAAIYLPEYEINDCIVSNAVARVQSGRTVIGDSGHWVAEEQPKATADALARFATEV